MLKYVKRLCLLSLFFLSTVSAMEADFEDKIYVSKDDLGIEQNAFYIHIGGNIWIEANTIHSDETGIFTFPANVSTSCQPNSLSVAYEKKWKCPYCNCYWPIGSRCRTPDCPSKY